MCNNCYNKIFELLETVGAKGGSFLLKLRISLVINDIYQFIYLFNDQKTFKKFLKLKKIKFTLDFILEMSEADRTIKSI